MNNPSGTSLLYQSEFKVITIKYFRNEPEAWLYVARLREVGISCFLSNTNASTAFPFTNGGIGLHVKEEDIKIASLVIEKLDSPDTSLLLEQSFHDADLDEIAYEKRVHEQKYGLKNPLLYTIIIGISILVVIRAYARAIGWTSTFDPF